MESLILASWTSKDYENFREYLKNLSDESYKEFNSRLIPDTPLVHGIRIPALRKIAKEILKGNYIEFLSVPKTSYHEEVIIEGLVMAGAKSDYAQTLEYMKAFTDKIYNWAINDTVSFKKIKNHTDRFINDVDWFIYNENPWAQRCGFLHLMGFCLTDENIDAVLKKVDSADSDFYYVQMMQAWLLATAIAKQRDKTMDYLIHPNNLNERTFKMTVKKARESFRVSKEDKEFLKSLTVNSFDKSE